MELTPGGEHAFRMLDPDPAHLWDVRFDVFDPGTGRHFEGPRWDELGVGFVAHEGEVYLFRTVLDEAALTVRLHLYRVEPRGRGRTGGDSGEGIPFFTRASRPAMFSVRTC